MYCYSIAIEEMRSRSIVARTQQVCRVFSDPSNLRQKMKLVVEAHSTHTCEKNSYFINPSLYSGISLNRKSNKYILGNLADIPRFTSYAIVMKPNRSWFQLWSIIYAKLLQMILFSKAFLS